MAVTDAQAQAKNQAALARSAKALAQVLGEIKVGGKEGLEDVGVVAVNRIRQKLSEPGKGRVYRRRRVLHRASAPGRPPAPDTGRLRASYTWKTGEDAQGPFVEIGTNVEYAPWLEFGTRRMAPRPHLRPVVQDLRNEIRSLVANRVIEAEKRAIGRLPKEIS